jgi:hypothetical protein
MSSLARVVFSPDTTPPTTPGSVAASALSQTAIRITWGASTDTGGSGLAGYRVYRSTTSTGTYTQIGSDLTTASLSYDDTGLSAGTTWFYRIVSFDGNSNASSQSTTASATTTASASWADVTVGFSAMPAQLGGTNGRKVRMDLSGTDWGATQIDTTNGASVTRISGGAYDGTDCLRLVPPSGSTPNGNQTYCAIMRNLDLSNGGAKDSAQANLGFCIKPGSRYWDLGHQDKLTGIVASLTVGGAENASASRAAVFDAFKDVTVSDLRRLWSVTATTVVSYHYPTAPGQTFQTGPDANKLMILGNTSNHANDPPLVNSEWLYFEQEVDYRQDRGNANGRNRLDVWARDGYLGFLEIPLTWREQSPGATWDFSYRYARVIEYIGGLWNNPGTANANNYLDVSHPIVAVNRAKDSRIGPPPGFLT